MKLLPALISASTVLAATVCPAFGLECRPGGLSSAIGSQRNISTLTIEGEADASDLFFIADSLPGLTDLDMSGLSITAYHGKTLKGSTVYPSATIPPGTFGGSGLQSVALPSGIAIGDMAFASSALKAIEIPSGTRALGSGAFADCRELKEATLPYVANTGTHIFRNCTALERIKLEGTNEVTEGTFSGCTSLSAVEGTQSLERIGNEAFHGTVALKNFPFPSALKSIGERAFASSGLAEIELPASLASIGKGAFFGCTGLTRVVMPSSLAEMSDYLFSGSPVAEMNIPENLQNLGRYSLKGTSLIAVILPSTLADVGDGAMEGMDALREIDVNALEAVPATGKDVWAGVDAGRVKLYVGSNKADFENAPQWQDFDITNGSASTDKLPIATGVTASMNGGILSLVSGGPDITELTVVKASGETVLSSKPMAQACIADMSGLAKGTIIIVATTLADGSRSIIKFAL